VAGCGGPKENAMVGESSFNRGVDLGGEPFWGKNEILKKKKKKKTPRKENEWDQKPSDWGGEKKKRNHFFCGGGDNQKPAKKGASRKKKRQNVRRTESKRYRLVGCVKVGGGDNKAKILVWRGGVEKRCLLGSEKGERSFTVAGDNCKNFGPVGEQYVQPGKRARTR